MGILSWRRELKDLGRLREIVTVLVRHGYHAHLAKAKLARHATLRSKLGSAHARHNPTMLRETLEELGPTFIKLGQILSLRPDLIPPEYCDELRKLQHRATPLPFAVVKGVVEAELGQPLAKIFKEFGDHPLAAASVSQVHTAVLHDGTRVVVKVQRPGVRDVMARDIEIMEYLAERFDRHYPEIRAGQIVREFKNYTARELDFRFELRNTMKLHTFFAAHPDVAIPTPYEEHCTSSILVLEYLEGIPLTEKDRLRGAGFTPATLVKIIVKAMLLQAFELGIFHGDAHPGNLVALHRHGKPAIGFLDFGIVGLLDNELQRRYLDLFKELLGRDVRGVANTMLMIGDRGPGFDYERFKADVGMVVMDWHGTSLRQERLSQCLYRVITTGLSHRLLIPPNAILFAKALVTVEGSVTYLVPDFDLAAELGPKVSAVLHRRNGLRELRDSLIQDARDYRDVLRDLPRAAETLIDRIEDGEVTVRLDVAEFRRAKVEYDVETSRTSLALIAAAFFVGSAFLAGMAPELGFLGFPFYEWGFGCFFLTLLLLGLLTARMHKFLENEL
jgi:ubiquinone biosynthesis protein